MGQYANRMDDQMLDSLLDCARSKSISALQQWVTDLGDMLTASGFMDETDRRLWSFGGHTPNPAGSIECLPDYSLYKLGLHSLMMEQGLLEDPNDPTEVLRRFFISGLTGDGFVGGFQLSSDYFWESRDPCIAAIESLREFWLAADSEGQDAERAVKELRAGWSETVQGSFLSFLFAEACLAKPERGGNILVSRTPTGNASPLTVEAFRPFAQCFLGQGIFEVTWMFTRDGFKARALAWPRTIKPWRRR